MLSLTKFLTILCSIYPNEYDYNKVLKCFSKHPDLILEKSGFGYKIKNIKTGNHFSMHSKHKAVPIGTIKNELSNIDVDWIDFVKAYQSNGKWFKDKKKNVA